MHACNNMIAMYSREHKLLYELWWIPKNPGMSWDEMVPRSKGILSEDVIRFFGHIDSTYK